MGAHHLFLLLSSIFFVVSASDLSPCLQKCLEPMAKIERTISYLYRRYDDVCETLESSAICSQGCSQEDRSIFFQYTTFYRVHCIEMEEELEEHLPCLREASYKADYVCREKCNAKQEKTASKSEKQKHVCKTVECSTICYFKQFSQSCPAAQDALMRANIRNADEMRRLTHDSQYDAMDVQCQRIHDSAYIQKQLIDSLKQ
ncbi:CPG4 domain-containing protein [Aphelenchoides besseyi]|nr:CPG4 domain-containing protein [Aphelenchoides besseyi]KAI6198994.1 CPG4 domain-containing protein [Aphelenchoides besseyi]